MGDQESSILHLIDSSHLIEFKNLINTCFESYDNSLNCLQQFEQDVNKTYTNAINNLSTIFEQVVHMFRSKENFIKNAIELQYHSKIDEIKTIKSLLFENRENLNRLLNQSKYMFKKNDKNELLKMIKLHFEKPCKVNSKLLKFDIQLNFAHNLNEIIHSLIEPYIIAETIALESMIKSHENKMLFLNPKTEDHSSTFEPKSKNKKNVDFKIMNLSKLKNANDFNEVDEVQIFKIDTASTQKAQLNNLVNEMKVEFVSIKDPEEFYVRLASDKIEFEELQQMLDKTCGSVFQQSQSWLIKVNDYCFAFSARYHRWCRGQCTWLGPLTIENSGKKWSKMYSKNVATSTLISKKKIYAKIRLLDFGITENIEYFNLRSYSQQLFNVKYKQCYALKCSLYNLKPTNNLDVWSEEANEVFVKFVNKRLLRMVVKETINEKHYVDLFHEELEKVSGQVFWLTQIMVYSNVARFKLAESKVHYFTSNTILTFQPIQLLEAGQSYSVYIVYIENPDLFYVSLAFTRNHVIDLHQDLEIYHSLSPDVYTLYCPKKNSPCVALHRGTYYRALILDDCGSEKVKVQLVDFGNTVIVSKPHLRVIRDEFLELPIQAIPCRLADVAPLGKFHWDKLSCYRFRQLLTEFSDNHNRLISMTLVGNDLSQKNCVVLRKCHQEEDVNINVTLVEENFAQSEGFFSQPMIRINSENFLLQQEKVELHLNKKRNNEVLKLLKDFDVSGYNILKEITARNEAAKAKKADLLIKAVVTFVQSPSLFYIQIGQTEVTNYLRVYEDQLRLECDGKENQEVINLTLEIGEICAYFIEEESGRLWRRGIVIEKNVSSNEVIQGYYKNDFYKIKSKDYGNELILSTFFLRKIASGSRFKKDDDFCIKCNLFGLIPAGGSEWTCTAREKFSTILDQHRNSLYILIKQSLSLVRPESLSLDIFAKEINSSDSLAPKEVKYTSFSSILIDSGCAMPLKGQKMNSREDEDELNTKMINPILSKLELPLSYQTNSIISLLKKDHHKVDENKACQVLYYSPALLPECETFQAICTEAYDLKIWFRVIEPKKFQSISIINSNISKVLKEKDKLTSFQGEVIKGRACSAYFYHDKTWNRAELVDNKGDYYHVIYVDYGNRDRITKEYLSSDVFNIDIPKLGLYGTLHGCEIIPEVNKLELRQAIFEHVIDKTCSIIVKNYNSFNEFKILITLPDGRDLKQLLIQSNLIRNVTCNEDTLPASLQIVMDLLQKSIYQAPDYSFEEDKYYPVVVSEFLINNYFFIQAFCISHPTSEEEHEINERNQNFLNFQTALQSDVHTYSSSYVYRVGECCCAQYSIDKQWYRGLILEEDNPGKQYKVHFVDYGNTEKVKVSCIRDLPQYCILDLPIQTILVQGRVKPLQSNIWTSSLNESMKSLLEQNSVLLAKFSLDKVPFEVDLFEADANMHRIPVKSIFQDLINQGQLIIETDDNCALISDRH